MRPLAPPNDFRSREADSPREIFAKFQTLIPCANWRAVDDPGERSLWKRIRLGFKKGNGPQGWGTRVWGRVTLMMDARVVLNFQCVAGHRA
jgi:hypothetical protein